MRPPANAHSTSLEVALVAAGRVSLLLALASVLSCADRAPDDGTPNAPGGVSVGSVASMLDRLSSENTRISKRTVLPLGRFGEVPAVVEDFQHEHGQLSMTGRPMDSADSEFILKADEGNVYGWVVYRDRNVAYELTSDEHRNVVVEEVPVTKIFPICELEPPHDFDPGAEAPPATSLHASPMLPPHVGTYASTDVTKLQSMPGAPKVFYINLTDVMNGTMPIGQTPTDVWQTWQSLAATLSAFKVNVTTDAAVYAAAGAANSGVARMANVSEGSSSCGLNVFGTTRACDVHRYRNGYATGRILAHEVGHALGMNHDGGNDGGEYFNGLAAFQWTPLMGNIWPGDRWANALYQWSKGEYASATENEDDFALLDRHLDYRDDDIASVKPLRLSGSSVPAATNWGQIGRNTDTDSFSFRIGASGGHAALRVDRIEYLGGAMLDVDASIVNSAGMAVAQNNAAVARHAQLDVDLPAGDYTLLIKGGAEGTPANGFSSYSSVGFYGVDGMLTGAVDPGTGGTGGLGGMGGGGGLGTAGLAGGGSSGAGGANAGAGGVGAGGASAGSAGASAGSAGSASGGGGAGVSGASSGGTSAGSGASGALPGGSAGMSVQAGSGGGSTGPGGSVGTMSPPSADTAEESGCGCRVAGKRDKSSAELFGVGLLLLFGIRRKSRA